MQQVVEEVDGGAVEGSLEVGVRHLTFTPDQPWEAGTLYRYTLASETSGCASAICSEDQLPLQTALLETAAERGCRIVDGLGMLLHQARPAFQAFFGAPVEVDAGLRQKVERNIGLV